MTHTRWQSAKSCVCHAVCFPPTFPEISVARGYRTFFHDKRPCWTSHHKRWTHRWRRRHRGQCCSSIRRWVITLISPLYKHFIFLLLGGSDTVSCTSVPFYRKVWTSSSIFRRSLRLCPSYWHSYCIQTYRHADRKSSTVWLVLAGSPLSTTDLLYLTLKVLSKRPWGESNSTEKSCPEFTCVLSSRWNPVVPGGRCCCATSDATY